MHDIYLVTCELQRKRESISFRTEMLDALIETVASQKDNILSPVYRYALGTEYMNLLPKHSFQFTI